MKHQINYRCAILIAITMAHPAHAGIGKVSTPGVDKGEVEIDYNARRTGDDRAARNNTQKHVMEFEYGMTDDWQLGLEFIAERNTASSLGLEAYGFETQYELTRQGDWWFSSALKGEYAHARETGVADEGEFKLLLQRDEGRMRTTLNINLVREFGDTRDGGVGLETALQGLYRCNRFASPGLEWHAEYGHLDNFSATSQQEHYVGPILKGELFELGAGEIGYEAGYYWGLSDASADNAQRFRIHYEIRF